MDNKVDDTIISAQIDTVLTPASDIASEIPLGIAIVLKERLASVPLEFLPDDHIAYDQLEESLHNLAHRATFSFDAYDQALNGIISQHAEALLKAQKAKINQSVTQRKQIAVIDEETGESIWKTIPSELVPRFATVIADTELDYEQHPILRHQSPEQFDSAEMEELLAHIDVELINNTAELTAVVPTIQEISEGRVDGLRITPGPMMDGMPSIGLEFIPNSRILTTVRKKVLRLANTINSFVADPSGASARQAYEVNKVAITEELTEIVEATLLCTTTELYNSLTPQELAKSKSISEEPEETKLSKRQKRRLKQLAQEALQDTLELNPVLADQTESERLIEDVMLSLPWLDEGELKHIDAREMTNGQNTVYIINGMEDKMQKIANETLDKGMLEDKVIGAINTQANLLLAGYMPWDRQSTTVKSLSKNGSSPVVYRDEAIWYSYDLRPNAPRVYYIIKDASEIEVADRPALKPDAKCMIVVAITDKSQQIDVLKRFTGKNRSALRAQGAGSV